MNEIRIYKKPSGKEPFTAWIEKIKDKIVKARIRRRIDRLRAGHEGDCKSLGDGVFELRLLFGAGYRIYYGKYRKTIVILLCGGDKSSQSKDIAEAKQYWRDLTSDENK